MPNIMEISGMLSGAPGQGGGLMDLRKALALHTVKKIRAARKVKAKKARKGRKTKAARRVKGRRGLGQEQKVQRAPLPGGMNAGKALELAERFFREGKRPLAIAWARQAENRGKAEGKSAIVRRAGEIIKEIRGAAVLQALAQYGDVKGLAMAQVMGIL